MREAERNAAGLAAAAGALDAELQRYEQLATAIQQERLTSEKSLRRAAQKLAEIGAADTRLGSHLQALIVAIAAVRDRQQVHATAVQARAEEIRRRSEALAALVEQWAALGQAAEEVKHLAQGLLGQTDGPNGGSSQGEATLPAVEERLGALAADAQELVAAAGSAEFPDVAAQAESLRLQLLAALNKVHLLRRQGGTGDT